PYYRTTVLQLGAATIDVVPFAERRLHVQRIDTVDLTTAAVEERSTLANGARAIVIADAPGRIGVVKRTLEAVKDLSENHGLSIVVIAHSSDDFRLIRAIELQAKLQCPFRIYFAEDLSRAAEFIRNEDPGPPIGNVKISPEN